jgi:hypothetical protein
MGIEYKKKIKKKERGRVDQALLDLFLLAKPNTMTEIMAKAIIANAGSKPGIETPFCLTYRE